MSEYLTWDDVLTCARTIWGESRGEPIIGQIAVGWVIRNRHESGKWFGRGSVADVCLRPWQFSAWNPNDPNRDKLMSVSLDDPTMQKAVYAALAALLGFEEDRTCTATHYFVDGSPEPAWAKGKTPVGRISRHVFFDGID